MNKLILLGVLLVLFTSGCIEEDIPATTTTLQTTTTETVTTTTIENTTTTLEEPESTTTTTMSRKCRALNFQIKSHSYKNDKLTFYFHNVGSEMINDFNVYLYYTNKTHVKSYTDQGVDYHVVRKYVLDAGSGLDNVTVIDSECGRSYFVNV